MASQLSEAGIEHTMIDNAFDSISNPVKAQELPDRLSAERIHRKLDQLARLYCPVYKEPNLRHHWSVMQAEYATDIVFKNQKDLEHIYSDLTATAIHTVKPENIATFLGQNQIPAIKVKLETTIMYVLKAAELNTRWVQYQ